MKKRIGRKEINFELKWREFNRKEKKDIIIIVVLVSSIRWSANISWCLYDQQCINVFNYGILGLMRFFLFCSLKMLTPFRFVWWMVAISNTLKLFFSFPLKTKVCWNFALECQWGLEVCACACSQMCVAPLYYSSLKINIHNYKTNPSIGHGRLGIFMS